MVPVILFNFYKLSLKWFRKVEEETVWHLDNKVLLGHRRKCVQQKPTFTYDTFRNTPMPIPPNPHYIYFCYRVCN